ncbi:rhodanese-like domain-containing protein [Nonlabens sp.]|nr:rhodanese-like domain-containing protein [Nonlabens sp.]
MFSVQSCFNDQPGVINQVSVKEAAKMMEWNQVKIIDVRSKLQFTNKHIKDAINIEVENEDFNNSLDQLDKKEPLLVYCNKGRQSIRCAQILRDKGFTLVYDMQGGISKWEKSGREVIINN